MFIFYVLYLIASAIAWWGYFGYHIGLFFWGLSKTGNHKNYKDIPEKQLPSVTVIVPCFNEEKLIKEKIENILNLDYPQEKLEVIFVDGGSEDKTVAILKENTKNFPFIKVKTSPQKGKISQINYILKDTKNPIVVITDVDGIMQKDTLKKLVKELKEKDVGVVGAFVMPQNACPEEYQYWKTHNRTKILESICYSTSIVSASCYAFKKELLHQFPEDVIADDIYLPFYANLKGYKALYSQEVVCFEKRSARNTKEMFFHKFRKANAYITEVLRFSYCLPHLSLFWRIIYLTRTLQVLGLPWILMILVFFSVGFISMGIWEPVIFVGILYVLSLYITHIIIKSVRLPCRESQKGKLLLQFKVFLITNLILLSAGISYPFFIQTSSYKKISQ